MHVATLKAHVIGKAIARRDVGTISVEVVNAAIVADILFQIRELLIVER